MNAAQGSDQWLEKLRKGLPEPLGGHLQGVLERPGELVLFAESAAWAGRLRLALPQLAAASEGRRLTIRLQQKPRIKK